MSESTNPSIFKIFECPSIHCEPSSFPILKTKKNKKTTKVLQYKLHASTKISLGLITLNWR